MEKGQPPKFFRSDIDTTTTADHHHHIFVFVA
jgi:hypothetical protein